MPRKPSAGNAPKRSSTNVRRTIGANVKARRLTLGWSQQELADRFGVSRATVSQYEIGTGEVSAGDLPRLAEILGIGLLDFYGHTPPVSAARAEGADETGGDDAEPDENANHDENARRRTTPPRTTPPRTTPPRTTPPRTTPPRTTPPT